MVVFPRVVRVLVFSVLHERHSVNYLDYVPFVKQESLNYARCINGSSIYPVFL